jgi:superfamily II DNA or RNA helicase
VIVVTDRRILDDQLQKTVKQFMQVSATVGHAKRSGDLRRFIAEGRKIIVTTVQKFPFILDEMEGEGAGKKFAIVIDEAHSSQGGKTASAMSKALGETDPEDEINDAIEKRIKSRKLLTTASYFAFTATPKNKTLELFGIPLLSRIINNFALLFESAWIFLWHGQSIQSHPHAIGTHRTHATHPLREDSCREVSPRPRPALVRCG